MFIFMIMCEMILFELGVVFVECFLKVFVYIIFKGSEFLGRLFVCYFDMIDMKVIVECGILVFWEFDGEGEIMLL